MSKAKKKIMLLGGIYYLKPAIEAAHKLGLYVITADNLPNNVAHQWSDEFVNVSIIDKEAVLKVAREKEIDGILSYAVDPGVVTAAYVAEQMGLPNVGPYKSVKILQNKALFRQFLADNGFNTPKAQGFSTKEEAMSCNWVRNLLSPTIANHRQPSPLIIKPTDSAGSKGVSRVDNMDAVEEAVEEAFRCSISKHIIIEEFIELEGYQSGSDSFSIDGQMVFTSFDDQRFDKHATNPYAPSAHTWPSTMPEWAQEELKNEIQRLVTLLGMRTSLYNIEARVGKNGKTYIMELSPRAGGNRLAEVLTMAMGIDWPMACVKAAIGEDVTSYFQSLAISHSPFAQSPFAIRHSPFASYNGYWADVVLKSHKTGKFDKVVVADELKPYVKELALYKEAGEQVDSFGAANAAVGSMFLRFDTRMQLEEYFDKLDELVRVNVEC